MPHLAARRSWKRGPSLQRCRHRQPTWFSSNHAPARLPCSAVGPPCNSSVLPVACRLDRNSWEGSGKARSIWTSSSRNCQTMPGKCSIFALAVDEPPASKTVPISSCAQGNEGSCTIGFMLCLARLILLQQASRLIGMKLSDRGPSLRSSTAPANSASHSASVELRCRSLFKRGRQAPFIDSMSQLDTAGAMEAKWTAHRVCSVPGSANSRRFGKPRAAFEGA